MKRAGAGHGRIHTRTAAKVAIADVTTGLPYARSTVVVRRDWQITNAPEAQQKPLARHFPTSLGPGESLRIPTAVRGN
jgi:hypothetical protein